MKRALLRHPALVLVIAASLWLLAGFTFIDQRWRWPYDDASWGTAYFFGQVLANFILWPGFSVADTLGSQFAPVVRWSIATVVSVALALLLDWLLQKTLLKKTVTEAGS